MNVPKSVIAARAHAIHRRNVVNGRPDDPQRNWKEAIRELVKEAEVCPNISMLR